MTELVAAPHPRWKPAHFWVMALVGVLQGLFRSEVPFDHDMYWSARFGTDVLNSGHLLHVDTYSWSAHGATWVPNSWGWDVILGSAYRAFGVAAFSVVGVLLAVALAFVVARVAARLGARPLATAAIYAPVGLLALASIPRGQAITTIAVLLIPILVRDVYQGSRRAMAATVLLQMAWMNLHSGALIGPVLFGLGGAGLVAVEWVFARRQDPDGSQAVLAGAARILAMTLLGAAACFATPYGAAPITHAADVRAASIGLIIEWDHVGFGSLAQVVGLIAVIAAIPLVVHVWREGRPEVAVAILALAAFSADALRFLPMLAVVACAELALLLGRLNVRDKIFGLAVAAACVVLASLLVANSRDLRHPDLTVSPTLISRVPPGCRLLNDDAVGDVIVLLRPDVQVGLDGRNDVYGRQRIRSALQAFADLGGSDAYLANNQVDCVLARGTEPLVHRLSTSAGWTVLGHDSIRTLLIRNKT